MRSILLSLFAVVSAASALSAAESQFLTWAPKPPMGWNSWDCFATTVTEAQAKQQGEVMAKELVQHGWQYLVVDIQWYEPDAKSFEYRKGAKLTMDSYGRLLPAVNRFPSATEGIGFRALADYFHRKGLKFGVHLLRGIPRQAVEQNTPVKGTSYHAADIADRTSVCEWNTDMYGVDMAKPGAQEYYDSVFALLTEWQIDFVKVDDLSRPYHKAEIEGIRHAIDHAGRPIVLSLSPGETPLTEGSHVSQNANMWRISDDFWDKWSELEHQFERCRKWTEFSAPGHFPDADMLPLGVIAQGKRHTHFTPDEQHTLMTLWSMARSPLIFGGDLTKLDEFTLSLITNDEVIAVDQTSSGNHQLFRRDDWVAWIANVANSPDLYLAIFNTRDAATPINDSASRRCEVSLSELGLTGSCTARDVWQKKDLGTFEKSLSIEVASHGATLYRISRGNK